MGMRATIVVELNVRYILELCEDVNREDLKPVIVSPGLMKMTATQVDGLLEILRDPPLRLQDEPTVRVVYFVLNQSRVLNSEGKNVQPDLIFG